VLFFGLAMMYPAAIILTWGAVYYLRARQQIEEIPPGALELSEQERAEIERKPKEEKSAAERLKEKITSRTSQQPHPARSRAPFESGE
jgi:hypothetical protein